MRVVKIYTLSHPITNEVKYVGKTVESLNERLRKHLHKKDKTYRYNWIISLKKEGLIPKIELIEECDEIDWRWNERYWISQFRTWGFRLVNLCDGGLGSNGMKHTKEAIEKIKKSSIGNKNRLGKTFSDESKNKIRLGNLNKKRSRVSVEKMIKTKTGLSTGIGRKHTNEHKENISKGVIMIKGKPIQQFDLNMKLIDEWESISLASKTLKIPNSNIVNVCKGNRKTAKNFIWKYKNN